MPQRVLVTAGIGLAIARVHIADISAEAVASATGGTGLTGSVVDVTRPPWSGSSRT